MVRPYGMVKRLADGVEVVTVQRGDLQELFITVHPDERPDMGEQFAKAWREVRAADATVLRQDVFGIPAEHDTGPAALEQVCGAVDWPVTWLEEGASLGARLTGAHWHAVRGARVRRVSLHGETVGSVFADETAEYFHLGGICCRAAGADRGTQARGVFERIEEALGKAGMCFGNVVRTWLYADRILDWYDTLNEVRTAFFDERGVFDGLVPASTGVGGGNLHGAALVADALAVKPLPGRERDVTIAAVPSPLQCPATDYRSSFSRAVEIACPDHRRLTVSGTASIEPGGGTARIGDVDGQIDLTLDVVGAILSSRGMRWEDVTRAIAYVKHGADAAAYRARLRDRGLPRVPTVLAENNICREELLFELEVDALRLETAAAPA